MPNWASRKIKFILTTDKISSSSLIFTLSLPNFQLILEEMFCLSDFCFFSLFSQDGLCVHGKKWGFCGFVVVVGWRGPKWAKFTTLDPSGVCYKGLGCPETIHGDLVTLLLEGSSGNWSFSLVFLSAWSGAGHSLGDIAQHSFLLVLRTPTGSWPSQPAWQSSIAASNTVPALLLGSSYQTLR